MSEMSDADVFGAPPAPSAAPQQPPANPTGDGRFIDAKSSAPLNAAQTAYYAGLLANGKFDPKTLPPHQTKEGEEPDSGPYVDLAGNLRQKGDQPPATPSKEMSDAEVFGAQGVPGAQGSSLDGSVMDDRPVSQRLGFIEGLNTVAQNLTDPLRGRFPGVTLPQPVSDALVVTHPLSTIAHAVENMVRGQTEKAEQTYRPGKIGKVGGEVLASAPFALDAEAPLAMGALQGYLTSEAKSPGGKLADTAMGAAGGKLADIGMNALRGIVMPKIRPEAQWAIDNGIRLTPGGISGGFVRGLEGAASKGTIAGPVIGAAQRRGIEDFNLATIQKNALEPAGLSLPPGLGAGHEAVNTGTKLLVNAYDSLAPDLMLVKDPEVTLAARQAKVAAKGLPSAYRTRLDSFADSILGNPRRPLSGKPVQELTSTLRQEAMDAQKSGDFFTGPYGRAIDDLSSAVGDALERSNPDHEAQLSGLNKGYAAMVRIQRAATNAVQDGGVFTPAGLLSAARREDSSVRDNATGRGQALLQDWANSGKAVLPDKLPTPGGVFSHLPEIMVTAGVGHEAGLPAIGGILAGEGGLAALYSKPAQTALTNAMTKRPEFAKDIAARLEAIRPLIGYGGATAAPKLATSVQLPQLPR